MTEETIYQEMLEVFQQETGYEMHAEADLAVRLRAAAAQIMSLYHYADYVYRQAFPQTAEGESLDRHGALRGVTRRAAKKAEGVLRFGISAALGSNLPIPAGTVCLTSELTAFETVEAAVLAAGSTSVDVAAQALETGSLGNVVAGTVTHMQTPPDGIEMVTNPAAFSGGREEESDESYRGRILAAYLGLGNGSNVAYYRDLAMSVDGVDRVKVIPRIDGAGSVGVLIASDSGIVSQETLNAVSALMEDRRELGIAVTVTTPAAVQVTIQAGILPKAGYTLAQAKELVKQALAACFMGDMMGKKLYRAALLHSAMDTGAIDNIVITVPAADVEISENQQPVLGTVTLEGL